VNSCLAACSARGNIYAGVEGSACWCGDQLNQVNGRQRIDGGTVCGSLCPGNTPGLCGGVWAINIYAVATVRWALVMDMPRILSSLAFTTGANTMDSCRAACATNGYAYAGLEWNDCWCDNQLESNSPSRQLLDDGRACNHKCGPHPYKMCGGLWAINIYGTGLATS